MFIMLAAIFTIFTIVLLVISLFTVAENQLKLALVFFTVSILSLIAVFSLFQITENDTYSNFGNQLRHKSVITQVKEVSLDSVVLMNDVLYKTKMMQSPYVVKEINVGDIVEIIYFTSKMEENYIYSIKKLEIKP